MAYPQTTNISYPITDTLPGRAPDGWYAAAPSKGTSGTVTVNGTTPVVVAAPVTTANSQVNFTLNTVGGTVGAVPRLSAKTAGTGFTVVATASDTSIYNWMILEPSPV